MAKKPASKGAIKDKGDNMMTTSAMSSQVTKVAKLDPLPLLPSRRMMLEDKRGPIDGPEISVNKGNDQLMSFNEIAEGSISTIKKGTLWQQQNFTKFHQRLFNRWKKRYFILTTHYLVCFSKSSSKLGRSEMGKFLYKAALSDVSKIEWLRPNKSDKGSIVIHLNGSFDLTLWSKHNLEEWMDALRETCASLRVRKPNSLSANALTNHIELGDATRGNYGFYENTHKTGDTNPRDKDEQLEASESIGSQNQQYQQRVLENRGELRQEQASTLMEDCNELQASSSSTGKINGNSALPEAVVRPLRDTGTDSLAFIGQSSPSCPNDIKRDSRQLSQKFVEAKTSQNLNGTEMGAGDSSHCDESDAQPNELSLEKGGSQKASREGSVPDRVDNLRASSLVEKGLNNRPDRTVEQRERSHMEKSNSFLRKPELPNLLRRDESWQSLVSLTRLGAHPIQVHQKQQFPADGMGQSNDNHAKAERNLFRGHEQTSRNWDNQRRINIESTVTPLRGPLNMIKRQQSLQAQRRPMLQSWQQSNSVDVPSNDALTSSQLPQSGASYHQKLMQLQMLHRNDGRDRNGQNSNEFQIYSPDSVATTTYGYYSMRSNLKSAASKFSFIRPDLFNNQPREFDQDNTEQKSTLPPQLNAIYRSDSGSVRSKRATNFLQNRMSFVMESPERKVLSTSNDHNNNSINVDHIRSEVAGNRNFPEVQEPNLGGDQITLAQLVAPTRELPLKPNKKRSNNSARNCLIPEKEPSSIPGGIVGFFRRAFSRQSSKLKKRKLRLGESSSSSLTFDENSFPTPFVQSAFSTGEKNVAQEQTTASQKMIQMIEEFANRTIIDQNYRQQNALGLSAGANFQINQLPGQSQHLAQLHTSQSQLPLLLSPSNDSGRSRGINFGGQQLNNRHLSSVLNKSSSVSGNIASVNFGSEPMSPISVVEQRNIISQGRNTPIVSQIESNSPVVMRSPRVMSANLTPLFSRLNLQSSNESEFHDGMSPRALVREANQRPSSIYGQPSLISSINSSPQMDSLANLGAHRNSLRNGRISDYDWQKNRRSHLMRGPFLDTTREVSEEVSTPMNDNVDFLDGFQRTSAYSGQPSQPYNQSNNFNPILHSPTMHTIYDNHPRLQSVARNNHLHPAQFNEQSYYGNNPGIQQMKLSSSNSFANGQQRGLLLQSDNLQNDALLARPPSNRSAADYIHHQKPSYNPLVVYNKPAAIVAPRTPQRSMLVNCTPTRASFRSVGPNQDPYGLERSSNGYMGNQQRIQRGLNASASPMASRRLFQHEPPLLNSNMPMQSSPLVNDYTRFIKRNDGFKGTIIDSESNADYSQPIIDRSKSTGVHLEADRRNSTVDVSTMLENGLSQTTSIVYPQKSIKSDDLNGNSVNSNDWKAGSNDEEFSRAKLKHKDSRASTSRSDISISDKISTGSSPRGSQTRVRDAQKRAFKKGNLQNGEHSKTTCSQSNSGTISSESSEANDRRSSSLEQSDSKVSRGTSLDEQEEKHWVNSKLAH